ncbi:hypothetical protein [Pseudomonas fluorescens]|uniref:hypothetical protein n=1 Tax=Pseudomonas fluorescens TaxID=294 RepID=UPI001241BADB|nr:hypothetical protein [Pseudomonas fluorescens]VVQ30716.1 hypothetical protein PS947_02087 [Pseudomonas fluorescens]
MSTSQDLKSALDAYASRQEISKQKIKTGLAELSASAEKFCQLTTRAVYNVVEPVCEKIAITANINGEVVGFNTQKIIFPIADRTIEFIPTFTPKNQFGFRTNGLQQELVILPKMDSWEAYSSGGLVLESVFTPEYFVSLLMSVIPNN